MKQPRIVFVDDEDKYRAIVARALRLKGYDVFDTDDGYKALTEHQKEPFDLALIDLLMPKMLGNDFARELDRLPSVPVKIFLTAVDTVPEDIRHEERIVKPFDLFDLIERIKQLLSEKGK